MKKSLIILAVACGAGLPGLASGFDALAESYRLQQELQAQSQGEAG